jgi:hypothetical protein
MAVFKNQMRALMANRTLSKQEMTLFANSKGVYAGARGFRAQLVAWHEAEPGLPGLDLLPPTIAVHDTTVLRWMHAADAVYGRHVKGFADRRNDADVVEQLQQYCTDMNKHQKRMPLWTTDGDGNVVFVDRLRADDSAVEACDDAAYSKLDTYYNVAGVKPPAACKHGHGENCRCRLTIMHWGHDEAVFWNNLLSECEWTIDGQRCLRPKNPGRGVMVSAFVCEQRGFGIHVSEDEWKRVLPIYNTFHQQHRWLKVSEPVGDGHTRQLGLLLFDYGGNKIKDDNSGDDDLKSGYWNCAKFGVQCDFINQCFNVLHGDTHQLMAQIDRSSGHMAKGKDALSASNIGMKDGGLEKGVAKQGLRDTVVDPADFGAWLTGEQQHPGMIDVDNPVQYGHYPPPGVDDRNDSVGPHYDNATSEFTVAIPPEWTPGTTIQFKHHATAPLYVCGVPAGSKVGDLVTININTPGLEWWRGMRKGKAQLLYETGWVDPAETAPGKDWMNNWGSYKPTPEEQRTGRRSKDGKRNAEMHLEGRKDFQNEKTVIEKLFIRHGNYVVASPKYHPEVAGLGIEYGWGKGKWCYVNDLQSKHLERNVLIALGDQPFKMHGAVDGETCSAPLSVERVRKFARRARTYCLLYQLYPTPEAGSTALQGWKEGGRKVVVLDKAGHAITIGKAEQHTSFQGMINKMYTTVKTHCNIIDVEFKVCALL